MMTNDPADTTVSAETKAAEEFDRIAEERYQTAPPDPDQPAATPEPNEPPPSAGVSASAPAEPAKPAKTGLDIESLSPEAREYVRKIQIERDAAIGRVAPIQRQATELANKLRAYQQQPASPAASPAPASPQSQSNGSYDPMFDSDEWKALERDYPEVAKPQRKAIELAFSRAQQAELHASETAKKLEQRFSSIDQFIQNETISREYGSLDQAHPDWRDIVQPKSSDDAVLINGDPQNPVFVTRQFAGWLVNQHPNTRQLFTSTKADDNIWLMDQFKRDAELTSFRTSAPTTPATASAVEAHQRRTQARAQSVAPDLRGGNAAVARVSTSQMSEAELFDWLAEQNRRRAGNR